MQCINFKSRLDREREMIRRKIRSSTLYRKPSFTKSANFNIYNSNGEVTKVSCISKNLKINELKDEPLRKMKSPLLVNNDDPEDDCSNEEKSILCIGSKYLDLTPNLMVLPLSKSVSNSTINLTSNDMNNDKLTDSDFERAISQSHFSMNGNHKENLKKPKTANTEHFFTTNINNITTNNNHKNLPNLIISSDGEDNINNTSHDTNSTTDNNNKRKDHHNNKIYKKSAHNLYSGAGYNVGKYSDAQKTEVVLDDLPNSITEQSNNINNNNINNNNNKQPLSAANTNKTVKKSAMTRKKSKKSDQTTKSESLKSTATRKSESSQMT